MLLPSHTGTSLYFIGGDFGGRGVTPEHPGHAEHCPLQFPLDAQTKRGDREGTFLYVSNTKEIVELFFENRICSVFSARQAVNVHV